MEKTIKVFSLVFISFIIFATTPIFMAISQYTAYLVNELKIYALSPWLYQQQIDAAEQHLKLILPLLQTISTITPSCKGVLCAEASQITLFLFFIIMILFSIKYLLNQKVLPYLGIKKCSWQLAVKSTWKIALLLLCYLLITNLFIHNEPDIAQQVSTSMLNPYVWIRSAIIYPVLEEIIFRGFLYQLLKNLFAKISINKTAAIIMAATIQSLIWCLQHLQYHDLLSYLDIFIMGLFLAYVREKTRSIYPAMAYHGISNILANILSVV